jgi:hypothetical protein
LGRREVRAEGLRRHGAVSRRYTCVGAR